MKHAGSQEALLARPETEGPTLSARRRLSALVRQQGSLSWIGTFAFAVLLVAGVADAPVRDLARSFDPSTVTVLRVITKLGYSAWPLGISLLLLGAVTVVSRQGSPILPEALRNLRSALIFVIGSVALSGAIARLAKTAIG